jgi:hypothetical protein
MEFRAHRPSEFTGCIGGTHGGFRPPVTAHTADARPFAGCAPRTGECTHAREPTPSPAPGRDACPRTTAHARSHRHTHPRQRTAPAPAAPFRSPAHAPRATSPLVNPPTTSGHPDTRIKYLLIGIILWDDAMRRRDDTGCMPSRAALSAQGRKTRLADTSTLGPAPVPSSPSYRTSRGNAC